MTPIPIRLVLPVLVLALTACAREAESPEPTAALDSARQAYADVGSFRETLELDLELSNGTADRRSLAYGVSDRGAFLRLSSGDAGLHIVAADGRALAAWSHVSGRFAEAAYEGTFADALRALEAEQIQLSVPPAVLAAQGGDATRFRQALGFGLLAEPTPTAARWVGGPDGENLLEVELEAPNGRLVLRLDGESRRFSTMELTVGEGDEALRARGRFLFEPSPEPGDLAFAETEGRAAVPTLAALEAADYPLGDPAPDGSATTLDGETIDLAAWRGKVVVLDFWATWCVPCWSALEHTEELAAWAVASGRPVEVWAVDSLEEAASLEEQSARARAFLDARGLDVPVLVDADDSLFAAFHNPGLPSLVIVDAEGRLAHYQSGVPQGMTEKVRERVLELLR